MNSETLSQSETDLLFNGGAAGDGSSRDAVAGAAGAGAAARDAADAASNDMQVYDFSRPSLISKERKRALDAMYGVLAKSVEVWLTGRVRGQIELTLTGINQLSFGEFVTSLPTPCSSFICDIRGSAVQAVIDFGQEFAFFLVERLLGANGAPVVQDRVLTPLERMIVKIAAEKVSEQLDEIWHDHVPLGLQMTRFESVPDMIQAASRQDPVLVGTLQVRTNGMEGTLTLCLPFSAVEKFFSGSGQQERRTQTRAQGAELELERGAVQGHLRSARVRVAVRTPACALSMADVGRLRVGATLLTGLSAEPESTIYVEDRPRFVAAPGRAGRQLAARITDIHDAALVSAVLPHAKVTDGMENGTNATAAATMPAAADHDGFGHLLGLSLPVTIELGRTRMTVQDVLELGRGSVVQLDRLVGEPVDILVGERRFAEGEVVVLGEQFGVRITRIINPNGNGK